MNIVILHGWAHSSKLWESFVAKFHGHKVTLFDLPGFGSEPLVSETWGVENYANWVANKLKAKKITKTILIGHSFGGKVATGVAISHPEMIKKLILISSPVLRRPSLLTKIKIYLYKLSKYVPLSGFLKYEINEDFKEAKDKNLGKIFVKSVNYDVTKMLPKLNIPTLIIWGRDDAEAIYPIGVEMAKLIPGAKLEILNNSGHNIQFENPNILYGFIQKFISNS